MNHGRFVLPFSSLEFLRDLWIAETIFVDTKEVQPQSVLHLALA